MKTFRQSLPYSAGALLDIAVVASVMRNAERKFEGSEPDSAPAPVGSVLLAARA